MVNKTSHHRALVTGAGKRIGRALARALARSGADVAVHYRSSAARAAQTVAEIVADGHRAVAVKADLMNAEQRDRLIADASEALGGPVTLLVNSAAAFAADRLQTHHQQHWDLHMETNLRAPVRLTQLFADQCPNTEHGLVVNLIDHRVWKLNPTYFTYTLAKSALWTATRTMAQALAPRIRVNALGPGAALPNTQESREEFNREIASNLMQRWPSPDMLAQALLYLVQAESVTGQMIAVDGGQHLVWQTPDLPDISVAPVVDQARTSPAKVGSIGPSDQTSAAAVEPVAEHEIFIDRLECEADIGINADEKGRRQTIGVWARVVLSRSVSDDDIASTIDYVTIVELIRETLAQRRRNLAETLASDIAWNLAQVSGVAGVEVRVDKPAALVSALPGVRALVGATARTGWLRRPILSR